MTRLVAPLLMLTCALGALGPSVGWAQATAPKLRQAPPGPPAPTGPKSGSAEPVVKPGSGPAGVDRSSPVTVDADQLENMQKEGLVVFTGNVVASQNNSTQYADRMEVYLDAKGEGIVRTVSSGNVKIITRDCKIGTARRAEYYDAEQRVVLIGSARVWQEDNVVTGERITMYLAEDRSVVEGGKNERVKAVFYPKSQEQPKVESKAATGAPCG